MEKTNKLRRISTRELVLVALFVALITVGGFIKVPIPNMVFTLQFLCTTLTGLLLGPVLGPLAVGIYVLMGLMGLPVFTAGGGPGYIVHPTFGYLLGMILGARVAGGLAEKAKTTLEFFKGALAHLAFVYTFGCLHYYLVMNYYLGTPMTWKMVLFYCLVLPITHDLPFCWLAAVISKRVKRHVA